jgi:hypothetical protein
MDPITNPFAPGAGTPPPELAGRDELRETLRIAIERVRRGLPTKSLLMVGLRGVGKTVLLDRVRIAGTLRREVTSLGPTRNQLIAKGMIWSPHHGDTAFTVPLFDEFMRRIMPGEDWGT